MPKRAVSDVGGASHQRPTALGLFLPDKNIAIVSPVEQVRTVQCGVQTQTGPGVGTEDSGQDQGAMTRER